MSQNRGFQYCSELYQEELKKKKKKNNIIPSLTDGYDCYQNALAERVNGILKNVFLTYKCINVKELNQLIGESIRIYNEKRPHFVHKKTDEEKLHRSNINLF